ncbi:tRNA pseudouridine38-40 synthase [Bacillus pakistanensis]|uniref:tRNA pseudouridine synthase A n=1 Tax=Rossellomorea pakistanensis TaxID=992288 RepID=A0ABS2NKL1_9BACI|nr:tRNA pseudouridine(38-40) synthase TruA [Bacillus pakistanensis]MBM7588407.1 tRNA pseudouridine38-40 synthase [Bacillus pakistanensis]
MPRFKCLVSYDGSGFSGYQVQPDKRTVQGEIEKALSKIHKGSFERITGSGRTDSGVHAMGQVFHFDSNLNISEKKWPTVLNSLLSSDISILSAEEVGLDFHARFSVKKKEYRYKIHLQTVRNPFTRHQAFHYPYPLNVEDMRKASLAFIGEHDFTSFCSSKTDVEDKIRTIYSISLNVDEENLIISYEGNGFLYNMVRIITGTLLEVGRGKITPENVTEILKAKDRTKAGKTAPPEGLYLWKVTY